MRQTAVRQRAGQGLMTGNASQEITCSPHHVAEAGRQKITESLTLEYGAMLESVAFIDRLNVFSPYGRLTYDLGNSGEVEFGYSSGAPRIGSDRFGSRAGCPDGSGHVPASFRASRPRPRTAQ